MPQWPPLLLFFLGKGTIMSQASSAAPKPSSLRTSSSLPNSSSPTNSSASSQFKLQGSRNRYFFVGQTEKNKIFTEAIDCIHDYLLRHKDESIPQLVAAIYNNTENPQVEPIREALRSRSFILDCLSASGNKILAYLAVLHNEKCLKKDGPHKGSIDLTETKKTIRSFFSNENSIKFDDSAIKHLKLEDTYFSFGKKRYAHLTPVLSNKATFHAIASRTTALTEGAQPQIVSLNINLITVDNIPSKSVNGDVVEVTCGNLHGNTILMLDELVQSGVLQIQDKSAWNKMTSDISQDRNHLDIMSRIRNALKPHPDFKGKIIFSGDKEKPRIHNDFFKLSILSFLTECKIQYTCIHSPADKAIIEYYLRNKGKTNIDGFVTKVNLTENNNSKTALDILDESLKKSTEKNKMTETFTALMENYLTHLAVFEVSANEQNLYCYGMLADKPYSDISKKIGIDMPGKMDPSHTAVLMGRWLRRSVFTDLKSYQENVSLLDAIHTGDPQTSLTEMEKLKNLHFVLSHVEGVPEERSGPPTTVKEYNATAEELKKLKSLLNSLEELYKILKPEARKRAANDVYQIGKLLKSFDPNMLKRTGIFALLKSLELTQISGYEEYLTENSLQEEKTYDKILKEITASPHPSILSPSGRYTNLDGTFGENKEDKQGSRNIFVVTK